MIGQGTSWVGKFIKGSLIGEFRREALWPIEFKESRASESSIETFLNLHLGNPLNGGFEALGLANLGWVSSEVANFDS